MHCGDNLDVLGLMPENSVDSIVTDPPYGISFMGKKWDYQVPTVEQWQECLRVLKPGGYLLSFGGSRTYHRLAVNIEDAGFELRDQIMWIYGSGFPKSMNMAKQAGCEDWRGWGTALKPAHEPIVMARKPFKGTVANNLLSHGTGAINIDECRVQTEDSLKGGAGGLLSHQRDNKHYPENESYQPNDLGRWPANLIHDGSDEVVAAFPSAKGQQGNLNETGRSRPSLGRYGDMGPPLAHLARSESSTSAARFFYCAKTSKFDRDEGLEDFTHHSAGTVTNRKEGSAGIKNPRAGAGRTSGSKNTHETVKPTALMAYLCKLVTPEGGVILDPWSGSGSTGKGAIREGYSFIGIELDPKHVAVACARIDFVVKQMSELKKREATCSES